MGIGHLSCVLTAASLLVGGPADAQEARFGDVRRDGQGPRDIVLMPCLGCDASSWTRFMERNRERYRMVAVTWPGMGATALPDVAEDPDGTPYFDHLMEALGSLLQAELARIAALATRGLLNRGRANSLRSKVRVSLRGAEKGHPRQAARPLDALENEVTAYERVGILTAHQARSLIGPAATVREWIRERL